MAEAKGTTQATGTDMDTAYGQLLRRMEPARDARAPVEYAVVVPAGNAASALRVGHRVRTLLNIKVYAVDDEGGVRMVGVGPVEDPDTSGSTSWTSSTLLHRNGG